MRTIVYIDGFNLFYGLLRNTPWLWLDLEKFVRSLLTVKYDIVAIKFFTARIRSDKFMPASPHEGESTELRKLSTFYKAIPRDLPAKCQLPDEVNVGDRIVHCPEAWRA